MEITHTDTDPQSSPVDAGGIPAQPIQCGWCGVGMTGPRRGWRALAPGAKPILWHGYTHWICEGCQRARVAWD